MPDTTLCGFAEVDIIRNQFIELIRFAFVLALILINYSLNISLGN